ncbi:related to tRNA (guanine-N(1)-)-methyltransferase [Rhynchosporium agropyri]|uniref:tRNA (guanine(9)-N1)-methyltransferase n=1 Tax=Rhynchosporium agropyri TaxID=914238 RepID=A0A1E1KK09_9HELO|nr:related to tRNA (guanine-N(1)-)-methyltransferase [Rhynchosporium agropyri]
MAESEERPSKIRKLNTSDGATETLQNDSTSIDAPPPQMAVEADRTGEDSKVSQVPSTTSDPPLSRNQLKKLRKQQQWEASKEFRKDKRKTLHREKQARKAEARKELNEKIAKGEIKRSEIAKPKVYHRPIQTPISFVLDCDFNELMTEKEIISLSAQITRSYSDNKTNPYRAHLAISSWGGPLKDRFENVLSSTHLSWKGVKFFEGDFVAAAKEMDGIMRGPEGGKLVGAFITNNSVLKKDFSVESEPAHRDEATTEAEGNPELARRFEAEENLKSAPEVNTSVGQPSTAKIEEISEEHQPSIVYLSSDSETTLSVLSPNTTYIIGGIVDKNRHKGLCNKRAMERGIPTARLPIGEYMTMASRSVLAVNHVVEIMLAWMETGDWGEAFIKVIPKRKEAKLRNNRIVQSEDGDNDEEPGASQSEAGVGEDREENDPSPKEESSGLESNKPS